MTLFRYKAVTSSDSTLEGEIEAPDRSAVIKRLHDLGQIPVRVEEVSGPSTNFLSRDLFGGRVSRKDLASATRELAFLLQAGLPLDAAFEVLINLSNKEQVKTLLTQTRDRVRGGATLADALGNDEKIFPPYYLSMVRAGETGGMLEDVLSRLAEFMEKSMALAERVKSALVYPIILLFMAGASIVLLLTVVIPQFKPMFEDAGQSLPYPTQIVVAAGDLFQNYWWGMLIAAIGVVVALRVYLSDADRRESWDRFLLRIPLLGELLTKIEVARFSRLLGTLLRNGVSLLNALELVRNTLNNSAIARAIDKVGERTKEGQGLARPLGALEVFPELAINLVRVGEETGQLEDMLARLADIYDREVERTLDRLLALMVPAFTITMGLLIGGIIASVLLAILSVNSLAF